MRIIALTDQLAIALKSVDTAQRLFEASSRAAGRGDISGTTSTRAASHCSTLAVRLALPSMTSLQLVLTLTSSWASRPKHMLTLPTSREPRLSECGGDCAKGDGRSLGPSGSARWI